MAGRREITVSRMIQAPTEAMSRVLDDTSRHVERVPQPANLEQRVAPAAAGRAPA